jgi:hypothetical protein
MPGPCTIPLASALAIFVVCFTASLGFTLLLDFGRGFDFGFLVMFIYRPYFPPGEEQLSVTRITEQCPPAPPAPPDGSGAGGVGPPECPRGVRFEIPSTKPAHQTTGGR